jgi:hypothetical protein
MSNIYKPVVIAQLLERKNEVLKVLSSILGSCIIFSRERSSTGSNDCFVVVVVVVFYPLVI